GKFKFYKTDICNKKQIDLIFAKEKPEIVVHFAAESHVDRSIRDATVFIETNIKGTQILMDASRKHKVQKFIFISTDEVYGEIANGKFNENSPIKPNSPYAASKAAADLLVQSYIRTYKFPAIIIRPSNNYGPWQYPEKLIPLAILRILGAGKVPVYGKGQNVREWLYVDDCARGIMAIMRQGKIGQIYNLGSTCESKNMDTIKLLLKTLGVSQDRFEFVKDRLGHDLRYSLNSKKITRELGWKPNVLLAQGLKLTVDWSLKHQVWLKSKLKDINKLYKE
ncbi:MAG: dTDP-glucose 4,6-dehydratase, partial [Candidatus Omnitrophota bacterium]|nr:dTDP-glucose 4,6-dehydratase [Candidatus Omnitrophota bacterium]